MKQEFCRSREEVILPIVRGKNVLDIGCVDHDATHEGHNFWLHKELYQSARSVLGIDILKKAIKQLRKKGYNIVYGDAERIRLKRRFDVVIAGEIIEHLSNPGLFLKNMHVHMRERGLLILTTPNARGFGFLLRTFLGNPHIHEDHVALYEETTLTRLLAMHGFRVSKVFYSLYLRRGMLRFVQSFLARLRTQFAPRIIILAEKVKT